MCARALAAVDRAHAEIKAGRAVRTVAVGWSVCATTLTQAGVPSGSNMLIPWSILPADMFPTEPLQMIFLRSSTWISIDHTKGHAVCTPQESYAYQGNCRRISCTPHSKCLWVAVTTHRNSQKFLLPVSNYLLAQHRCWMCYDNQARQRPVR